MSKLLLLFEEDAPGHSLELTVSLRHYTQGQPELTERQALLSRFNPERVGFGIVDATPQDYFESTQVQK